MMKYGTHLRFMKQRAARLGRQPIGDGALARENYEAYRASIKARARYWRDRRVLADAGKLGIQRRDFDSFREWLAFWFWRIGVAVRGVFA
jgi:hypothetical protein